MAVSVVIVARRTGSQNPRMTRSPAGLLKHLLWTGPSCPWHESILEGDVACPSTGLGQFRAGSRPLQEHCSGRTEERPEPCPASPAVPAGFAARFQARR